MDGDQEGQRVVLALKPGEDQAKRRWQLEFDGFNTLHLVKQPDGGVLIHRLDVATEAETIYYDPPVTLLPAAIVPDQSWTDSGTVRVWDWEGRRFEHQGTYDHRVLPISRERFVTPAGEFEGFLVEIEQTVDLQAPATLRLSLTSGFVAGEGMVRRSFKLVVDKPAWFGRTVRRTAELAR